MRPNFIQLGSVVSLCTPFCRKYSDSHLLPEINIMDTGTESGVATISIFSVYKFRNHPSSDKMDMRRGIMSNRLEI